MIEIQIRPYYRNKIDPQICIEAAQQTLAYEKAIGNATLVITGNREIQELNRNYRQIDAPTDVLSFSDGEPDPTNGELYLGDIVISYSRARMQANEEKHPVEDEIRLLVVHGMLHLLGYDHTTLGQRKIMWAHQSEILTVLGVSERSTDYLEKV